MKYKKGNRHGFPFYMYLSVESLKGIAHIL